MYQSKCVSAGPVSFPEFAGERVYMRQFTKASGLPQDLSRWQRTVDAMLDGVDAPGEIFIMIDQGLVQAGNTHRRGGPHIDGYWHADLKAHGGGGRHMGNWKIGPSWITVDLDRPEAIILASDVAASRGWTGEYTGVGEGGAVQYDSIAHLSSFELGANCTHIGNVGFVHESTPVRETTPRTLVRLSVKDWEPTW